MKCERDLPKKKVKNMNSEITTNSYEQLNLKEQKQKQTKQTTRTGIEPQKWRSHGGLSTGEWEEERWGKVQRISSINGR